MSLPSDRWCLPGIGLHQFTDFNLSLVPKELNFVQKHHGKTVAEEMISETHETDNYQ